MWKTGKDVEKLVKNLKIRHISHKSAVEGTNNYFFLPVIQSDN